MQVPDATNSDRKYYVRLFVLTRLTRPSFFPILPLYISIVHTYGNRTNIYEVNEHLQLTNNLIGFRGSS